MRDEEQPERSGGDPSEPVDPEPVSAGDDGAEHESEVPFDESLTEEISALIDDGRTYAEAEIAFQKTRASLAGRKIGGALLFGLLALVLLHLTLIALAVGLVIALEPLVTIWGAIGIVVGVLLLGVVVLIMKARSNVLRLAELFKDESA